MIAATAETRKKSSFAAAWDPRRDLCRECAYGLDVRAWDGYPVLRGIREVTMTTWIMQNVLESKAIADEFALRVACLREKDSERAWHFF